MPQLPTVQAVPAVEVGQAGERECLVLPQRLPDEEAVGLGAQDRAQRRVVRCCVRYVCVCVCVCACNQILLEGGLPPKRALNGVLFPDCFDQQIAFPELT